MSKKRKTRQEKIIAELRKRLKTESETTQEELTTISHKPLPVYTYSPKLLSKNLAVSSHNTMTSKTFLFRDIVKTAILTSSIVVFELILFYLLKIK